MSLPKPIPRQEDDAGLRERLEIRGAVLLTLTGAAFYALFIPINLLRGLEVIAWANVVMVVLFLVNLALLSWHRNVRLAASVALVAVMAWFWVGAVPGGPELFFWTYALPWVVFFFFGLRGGLAWTLALAAYFQALLHLLPMEFRHEFVPYTILMSYLAISGLAAIYEYLTHVYRLRIQDLSHRDSLTGVWNRRKFAEVAPAELARARRYGRFLSLLLLDIDHFKTINDTHGHYAGDAVLRDLARRIQAELRQSDYLFRWGGDEFVVLATETELGGYSSAAEAPQAGPREASPGPEATEGAWNLARKIQQAVQGAGPGGDPVSMSVGIAQFRPDDTEESLVRRADGALYAAKQDGGDCIGA